MRSVLQIFMLSLALGIILPESSHASVSIGETVSTLFKRCGTCESTKVCHDQKNLEWCLENCKTQIQRNTCPLPPPTSPKTVQKSEESHEERKGDKENMVGRLHSSLAGTGDHLFGVLSRYP